MLNNLVMIIFDARSVKLKEVYAVENISFSEFVIEVSDLLDKVPDIGILIENKVYEENAHLLIEAQENTKFVERAGEIQKLAKKGLSISVEESVFIDADLNVTEKTKTVSIIIGESLMMEAIKTEEACKRLNIDGLVAEVKHNKEMKLYVALWKGLEIEKVKIDPRVLDDANSLEDLIVRICREIERK